MNTNIQLSSLTNTTTYTGKDALEFYSAAILGGNLKSLLRFVPGSKDKVKIPRIEIANIVQNADCTFTPGGTVTLSQKTLLSEKFKVNLVLCTEDFENTFLSEQLRPGAREAQMPDSFQRYLVDLIAENINDTLENDLLNSSIAGGGSFDGLLTQFAATSSGVVQVTGATLSANNIISEIGKIYAAIPNTISARGKVKIYISPGAAKYYRQALAALNNAMLLYNQGDFQLTYIDIPIVVAEKLPLNKMFAAEAEDNLFFVTDLLDDITDIKLIPQHDITGAPNIHITAAYRFGVGFGVGEEIVVGTYS